VSRVYWDTMLFIYWLEDHPEFAKRVNAIHSRMEQRHDQLITGAFTFGEVLAGAYRKGASHLADESRRWLGSVVKRGCSIHPRSGRSVCEDPSNPWDYSGDAIHLASAAQAGTDLFLTNDKRLLGKIVPGIQFIASLDTQFF